MQNSDYLISENPMKALVFFSLPMIIGNLFQQAYTMADSAIVGRLVGENALAAVGAAYSLTNIFICIAIGGGIGASVIVSQYFGRGSYGKLKKAVYTALISFLLSPNPPSSPNQRTARRIRTVVQQKDYDCPKHSG